MLLYIYLLVFVMMTMNKNSLYLLRTYECEYEVNIFVFYSTVCYSKLSFDLLA